MDDVPPPTTEAGAEEGDIDMPGEEPVVQESEPDKPQVYNAVYKTKEFLHDVFIHTGIKERFLYHINNQSRLMGWSWKMRDTFIDYIKRTGANNVNVSHMIMDLAETGRDTFPPELHKEMMELMLEMCQNYLTIDETISPDLEPDNPNSAAVLTFTLQPKDVQPDPGLGIGVNTPESPPLTPTPSPSETSPGQSPGSAPVSTANASTITNVTLGTSTTPIPSSSAQSTSRQSQSPMQSNPRQSPSTSKQSSAVPSAPLPPPPVLKPEAKGSSTEVEEEYDDDDDDDIVPTNEEDELMDV